MNRAVWKFRFPITESFDLQMPRDAQILHVEIQNGAHYIWALVNTDASLEARTFHIFGTGHPIPEVPLDHIATWLMLGGVLVWHLFEDAR